MRAADDSEIAAFNMSLPKLLDFISAPAKPAGVQQRRVATLSRFLSRVDDDMAERIVTAVAALGRRPSGRGPRQAGQRKR